MCSSFFHKRGVFTQIAVFTYATNKDLMKIMLIEEIQKQFLKIKILIARKVKYWNRTRFYNLFCLILSVQF